jgi:subtilisin family serine protease
MFGLCLVRRVGRALGAGVMILGLALPGLRCSPSEGDSAWLLAFLLLNAAGTGCPGESRFHPRMSSGDPLIDQLWHLNNQGQGAFASGQATPCEDIRVADSIVSGLTGAGVVAVVVDEGFEISHEDLAPNAVPGGSRDFTNGDADPTRSSNAGDHGTSVGGLIAARGFNDVGARGVAPLASIQGWNFLEVQSAANQALALGGAGGASNGHVFNMSYGVAELAPVEIDAVLEAHLNGAARTTLRGGRGGIFVKSAGNGFGDIQGLGECQAANFIGVSCQNANMDPTNTAIEVIVAGALNARGVKASYSTAGSAILVSAPGGEFGFNIASAPGLSSTAYSPAMITVDQAGCNRGSSRNGLFPLPSAFMNNANGRNANCNYMSTFNGTSSAAPVISGVIALLLEANPNLSWRDVQLILASTARQVDPNRPAVIDRTVLGGYESEPAWTTNAAGLKFHNWYGFGAIDADSAIALARNYTSLLPAGGIQSATNAANGLALSPPDNSATGVSSALNIGANLTIETVQIEITITSVGGAFAGTYQDIGLELTSPSGTRSVLLNNKNGWASAGDMVGTRFRSNAFMGETSAGAWTLRVIDGFEDGPAYTLTDWRVRIFGH